MIWAWIIWAVLMVLSCLGREMKHTIVAAAAAVVVANIMLAMWIVDKVRS